jgi:aminoglycoside phosphotransferase (APT) family kinase protein
MSAAPDRPQAVAVGPADVAPVLPDEAVAAALRDVGQLRDGDRVTGLTQLTGGWSRLTHIADVRCADGSARRYVVRVRPAGALLDTDLGLEYRLYGALSSVAVPTPEAYVYVDDDDTPLGGSFIVMEHVEGTAPHTYDRGWHRRLADDFAGGRGLADDMVENLATIHSVDRASLPDGLPELGFADVVARWREVYEQRRLIRDPVIEEAFAWVAQREPAQAWTGLVHGDYRLGNTLIHEMRVAAILDWELAYLGDVRFDLGYLAMARAAAKHLTARTPLMATFADQEWFMDRYAQLTGHAVSAEDLSTFEMLGIMMLLATQLTAAWMYAHGKTTDVRMAWSRFSFAGLRQDMTRLMGW